jgi:hypothetical protein
LSDKVKQFCVFTGLPAPYHPLSERYDKIKLLDFTTLHDSRRYTIPRCLGPSHPDTKARCAVMMIRPYTVNLGTRHGRRCWTAVRNRRSGPRRAPPKGTTRPCGPWLARRNTRGAHEHVDAKIESGLRLRVALAKVPGSPVILGWAGAPRQAAPTQGPCLRMLAVWPAFLWSPVLRLPRSPLCRFAGPPSLPSLSILSYRYLILSILSILSYLMADR